MAKRKQEATADEILKQMFPDLPDATDYEDKPDVKTKEKSDDNPILAQLQAQVQSLQSQLASQGRKRVNEVQDTVPLAPQIDYDKFPDPADDPKGYARAVVEANNAVVQYHKDAWAWQQRQASKSATKADDLWAGFSSKYGDYAKNDKRVKIAAQNLLSEAKARGEDINDYMYGHSDQFYSDLVAEMDDLFGKPKGSADDEDDDDRADALPGGQIGGQDGPSGERKAPPSRYGELGSELRAWQEKTGFYR